MAEGAFSGAGLAELLGSRICHDLVSPIGAIGNGVELMAMAGGGAGPELALIEQAVGHASARLKFFRIAFGAAKEEQSLSQGELVAALAALTAQSRLGFDWQAPQGLSRPEAKALFLALMVLERAAPWGGAVELRGDQGRWSLTLRAPRLRREGPEWALLSGSGADQAPPAPGMVEFALLPAALAAQGRSLSVTGSDTELTLHF